MDAQPVETPAVPDPNSAPNDKDHATPSDAPALVNTAVEQLASADSTVPASKNASAAPAPGSDPSTAPAPHHTPVAPSSSLPEWTLLASPQPPSNSTTSASHAPTGGDPGPAPAPHHSPSGAPRARSWTRADGHHRSRSPSRDPPLAALPRRINEPTTIPPAQAEQLARERIYDVRLASRGTVHYEPLRDASLHDHFCKPSVRAHLERLGIIDTNGVITPDPTFRETQLALDRAERDARARRASDERDLAREVEVLVRAGTNPIPPNVGHGHDRWSSTVEAYTRSQLPPLTAPPFVANAAGGLAARYPPAAASRSRSSSTPAGAKPLPIPRHAGGDARRHRTASEGPGGGDRPRSAASTHVPPLAAKDGDAERGADLPRKAPLPEIKPEADARGGGESARGGAETGET
ncbi:hypothetical protein AMAG_01169 [Allomyces macrogynus ATCC 38327]|uniref:Uncharacterized protein n=1 Tax=Allomyces macrogynus (strain ATCC 38327) TaxID=578462 RepID=A0A0L0RYW6_ALLM3|nr:hypothetical protein AMAG_01169 [Allomyces macrogynus ATCC 38327]|eukprot:KNE55256.1 hypothetical protein AMAG_01169 [Allomyces macrogynus ATCC 38327]